MSIADRLRRPRPIEHECLHCNGTGHVDVYCLDCGEQLFEHNDASDADSKLNPDCDDICKDCLENRREDAAEQAGPATEK